MSRRSLDDELLTKHAAAVKLKHDRRVVLLALENVPPDDSSGKYPRWRRSTIEAALAAHSERTLPYQRNGHAAGESRATISTLTAARADYARERATLLRLEREERQGKLVNVDDVMRYTIEPMVHNAKTAFMRLPSDAVPELLLCGGDGARMWAVLMRKVREILTELSRGPVEVANPGDEIEPCVPPLDNFTPMGA